MPVVDYTRSAPSVKLRKGARYLRLYGPRRTLSKIEGQYHMRGRALPLVSRPMRIQDGAHVGIIGCGNFAFTTIAHYLSRNAGAVIRGAMDVVADRADSLSRRYGAHYATTDADRLIDDPAIDLLYIASNHASHADYAVRALRAGKSVHIEKPHVVDLRQLAALHDAMTASEGRVRLGFNRPMSPLSREVARLCATQRGPVTANWFVVGYRLPEDHWYNDPREGGRVLGNLCHWTDFLYRIVPEHERYPIEIRPIRNDLDLAVGLVFGGHSSGTVTFAASGDAFEGVRETLGLQRGDLVARLTDFERLSIDIGPQRRRRRLRTRDHGHEESVMRSYRMSGRSSNEPGDSARYVWETGELFLGVREALDHDRVVRLVAYDSRHPAHPK